MFNEEYKKVIREIQCNGAKQVCRNGENLIIPHYAFTLPMRYESDYTLTLRKMFYKGVQGEFKTFIDPTPLKNVKQFRDNGCNYWALWAKEDGSVNIDYHNRLHPQLERVIMGIKLDRHGRRHHVELWSPESIERGDLSLPCCYHGLTFSVIGDVLHLKWTQRSVDVMVGLPSDVYLAHLFMKHVATEVGLTLGTCMFSLSNVHIYTEHLQGAAEILTRTAADKDKKLTFKLKA